MHGLERTESWRDKETGEKPPFTILLHLPGRHDAETVAEAMIREMSQLPEHLRQSLTWDRGTELARYDKIQLELDMPVYFCDLHKPVATRHQREHQPAAAALARPRAPTSPDSPPPTSAASPPASTHDHALPSTCEPQPKRWTRCSTNPAAA